MNGRFQMQGGKNWILPKQINANRFFWDSHWLEIWSNHFCPSMGLNGGSVATDSGRVYPLPSRGENRFLFPLPSEPVFVNIYGAQELNPRNQSLACLCSLNDRYDKQGCRTSPPEWESIPGLLKRFTNTGSDEQGKRDPAVTAVSLLWESCMLFELKERKMQKYTLNWE